MRASLLLAFLSLALFSEAQLNRHIIKFTDKGSNPYSISDPLSYLSQRSIDRRLRYNIAIDSTDLPITPRYIDSLRAAGSVEILASSRWLNQVAIRTSDAAALAKISTLPFVESSTAIAPRISVITAPGKFESTDELPGLAGRTANITGDSLAYGYSNGQVKIHNGDFLHRLGFQGNGMQMALLDAGFYRYLSLPSFDSMRLNNQVLGVYDFVDMDGSVNEDHYHGMQCLSTIAANLPGQFVGTAPASSFYLFRTEDAATEYPIEEHFLAAGYEKADSAGVEVVSTSLGYALFHNPVFDHTYSDMDGNTTMAAKATNLGAKKGMLMMVSAGNEGNNPWHYVVTPGDADYAVTVGAVDTTGAVGSFSSYGPSSDGDVKPSFAAVGWNAIVASVFDGMPTYSSGTSFACPNLAGIATCLWQAFPEVSNMHLFEVMKTSSSRFTQPDDRVGYGIPDVKKAFVILQKESFNYSLQQGDCNVSFDLTLKSGEGIKIFLERKAPGENEYSVVSQHESQQAFALEAISFNNDISSLAQGMINYRMGVQIGTDTTFYLDSAQVLYSSSCSPVTTTSINLSPNPVIDQLNVVIENPEAAAYSIIVYNNVGQKVLNKRGSVLPGRNLEALNTYKWSQGTYVVVVFINGKKKLTKQVVLMR